MNFKIKRDIEGKAVALIEIGWGNAECSYYPGQSEFDKMLALSGLAFVDQPVPVKLPEIKTPTVEERMAALEAKVFGKG